VYRRDLTISGHQDWNTIRRSNRKQNSGLPADQRIRLSGIPAFIHLDDSPTMDLMQAGDPMTRKSHGSRNLLPEGFPCPGLRTPWASII
jgi:hypothetical protein